MIAGGDAQRLAESVHQPRQVDLPADRVDAADDVAGQAVVEHEQSSSRSDHRFGLPQLDAAARRRHGSDVVEDQRPSRGVVRLRVVALSHRTEATLQDLQTVISLLHP